MKRIALVKKTNNHKKCKEQTASCDTKSYIKCACSEGQKHSMQHWHMERDTCWTLLFSH